MSTPPSSAAMMGREYYVVDSFTTTPGAGNPAAVVLLPENTDDKSKETTTWMQTVAAEFNLSETAFCWPCRSKEASSKEQEEQHWNIRYYTPTVEVPLCGHATLASAAVLYQTLPDHKSQTVFHAREDQLIMELAMDDDDDTPTPTPTSSNVTNISMDFPLKPPRELTTPEEQSAVQSMLQSAFSHVDLELEPPLYAGISDTGDVLIELTPKIFQSIGYNNKGGSTINYQAFLEWDGYSRGVIVCCICEDESSDFLSRFFGPKAGINEDPVTGSAHCVLGPYFAQKLDKKRLIGKQPSERGGIVECLVTPKTIRLTGPAVTTMSGTLWF
jgi:predicted PhzF superfamily epimerase YddE/YHI9